MIEKILISACLLGERVRYDGHKFRLDSDIIKQWQQDARLISFCPEVAGGLSVPRAPAEILEKDGRAVLKRQTQVINNLGIDLTTAFLIGAEQTLNLIKTHRIRMAILKNHSPSCSNMEIYDGTFSRHLKTGIGVTAALLEKNHVSVFNENQISEAANTFLHI